MTSHSDIDRERETLRRLERIRRCAWEEGAWGTPGLDRDITETRAIITRYEESAADADSFDARHGEGFYEGPRDG